MVLVPNGTSEDLVSLSLVLFVVIPDAIKLDYNMPFFFIKLSVS